MKEKVRLHAADVEKTIKGLNTKGKASIYVGDIEVPERAPKDIEGYNQEI